MDKDIKRCVPLSLMSRGQRMLMLSLNKQTKANAAARVSKVAKPVVDYTWKVNRWIDEHRRYFNPEQVIVHELPTENEPQQQVIENPQIANEQMLHDDDTITYMPPDLSGHPEAVQAQQMLQSNNTDNIAACENVPPTSFQDQYPVGQGDDAVASGSRPNKRKRPRTVEQKIKVAKMKHGLLPPCGEKCRKKCSTKVTHDQRVSIHEAFWSMDYNHRRSWLSGHVHTNLVRNNTDNTNRHPRSVHNTFSLQGDIGATVTVCQKFFLSTLGYSSNRVLLELTGNVRTNNGVPTADRRGQNAPPNKSDHDLISEHIQSYHPLLSHYRREHAPLRRYITNETNLKKMHADFIQKHDTSKCSYETYRKIFAKLHISFAEPEVDKCDDCAFYEHSAATDELKAEWELHRERASAAREAYRHDSTHNWPDTTAVFAVDLQKVLLLPRMPDLKSCIFTSRLVVFNETFAMMGSQNKKVHYLALWNESIAGRSRCDIASAFYRIFQKERDCQEFIFWLDNCSAQNKNWVLYSMLLTLINRPKSSSGPQSIILRYLVPGHTHMAADSIHGHIEKAMRQKKNIFDMEDLVQVLGSAVHGVQVLQMNFGDFLEWDNLCRTRTRSNDIPLFRDIVEAKFMKGERKLLYKTSYAEEDYKKCDILKAKVKLALPQGRTKPRGILTSKKMKIVRDLLPKMPSSRRDFWHSVADCDTSPDLLGTSDPAVPMDD